MFKRQQGFISERDNWDFILGRLNLESEVMAKTKEKTHREIACLTVRLNKARLRRYQIQYKINQVLTELKVIKFNYIIGANIQLFVEAQYIKADPETNTPAEVEIIEVKDSEGLDVETNDISIGTDTLDSLLEIAAFEAHEDPFNALIERKIAEQSPAQQAKSAGLKSLTSVSDTTGVSLQTLTNWHKDKPKLFKTVLAGCVALTIEEAA